MRKFCSTLLALVFITSALFAQLPVFPPVANAGPFPTGKEPIRGDSPLNQDNARTLTVLPTDIIHEYTAYKGTAIVDGDYDEDIWNSVPWTEMQCSESRDADGTKEYGYVHDPTFPPIIWGGPSDFTVWFKVIHDADNVYVLTMRIDDDIDNTGTTPDAPDKLWRNDAFQMVLDSREPSVYETESPGAEIGFGHIGVDEVYNYWPTDKQNPATQLELAAGNSVSTSPTSTGKAIIYKNHAGIDLGGTPQDLHVMEVAFIKYPEKFADGTASMISIVALDRDAALQFSTILQWGQGVVGKDPYNYASILWSPDAPEQPSSINSLDNRSLQLTHYPNPVGNTTQISYVLKNNGHVSLKVYDISGRNVKTLVSEIQSSGTKTIDFNTSYLSSGIYFYTLETESYSATNKFLK